MGKEGRAKVIDLETAFRERTTLLYCQGLYRLFFDSFNFDYGDDERCEPGIVAKGFRNLYRMHRTFEGGDEARRLEYADKVRQSLEEMQVDASFGSIITSLRLQRKLNDQELKPTAPRENGTLQTIGLEWMDKEDLWLGAGRLVFENAYRLIWENRLSNYDLFYLVDILLASRDLSSYQIALTVEALIREFADRDIIIGAEEIIQAAVREREDRQKLQHGIPRG